MPISEQSNVAGTMSISDSATRIEKPKSEMSSGEHKFMFKRTEAGEKVRTLVEMKGDEIIRQGVNAAYDYLNGRKAYGSSKIFDSTLGSTGPVRSLLPGFLTFVIGVAVTLFIVSELLPNGLNSLFGN